MTIALIIVSILLAISVAFSIICLIALSRCAKAFKKMEYLDELRINCLARVLDDKQTDIFVKMLKVANKLCEENGITDMEMIDFNYLYTKVKMEVDSK